MHFIDILLVHVGVV